MIKLFKNGLRSAFFAALMMTGSAALADSAPPLVWMHDINDRVEKQRIKDYGVGPYADATSRLETELQAAIPLNRLQAARDLMAKMVVDPNKADRTAEGERILGKDHRVISLQKTPRDVWDMYLDTPDGKLAAAGASLRIRIENGVAKINFKPPGAQRFTDGMAIRVETGINIKQLEGGKLPAKLVTFLENTRLRDNPLREIPKLFPGMKAREFFNLQLEIKQQRNIYEVQQLQGGQWVKVGEGTIDDVTARDPAGQHSTRFGRVEFEGEHLSLQLSANQQAALNASAWKGPHQSSDTTNQAFTESDDVKHIRDLASRISKYLDVKPAGMSKYAQGRQELGAKGVTFNSNRTLFKGLRASSKPAAARQRAAKPKAPRAARPVRSARK